MLWGGWEGHEPRQCVERFVPFLEQNGFAVDVANDLNVYTDAARMADLALIVPCWTMDSITREQLEGLLSAVANRPSTNSWSAANGWPIRGISSITPSGLPITKTR
jgi:type 1 glutamine amidotransferase